MAFKTEIIGKYSELIARASLIANGWKAVSKSETEEAFDVSAKDPVNDEWKTFQVKTIHVRDDRNGEMKVNGRKGNGQPYDKSDADYFIGVLVVEGGMPRVWMFENREITEYWATKARASKRWVELPVGLSRSDFKNTEVEAI